MNNTTAPYLISLNDSCKLTSMSRTHINNLRAQGRFPQAVNLGEKRIAFVRAEVIAWIEKRVGARGAKKLPRLEAGQ